MNCTSGRPPTFSDEVIRTEAEMYLSGLSYIDIAHKLGMPKSTVAYHMKHRLQAVDPHLFCRVRSKAAHNNKSTILKEEVI